LITSPHETSTLVIFYRVHVKEFILQVVEVVVIEVKSSLEGTIRYPSLAFEEVNDLGENVIEGHRMTLHSAGFHCIVPLR